MNLIDMVEARGCLPDWARSIVNGHRPPPLPAYHHEDMKSVLMHPQSFSLDGPKISIAAGIVVGLLASFVQSLGLTVQRKSHIQNQALPEHEQKNEYRRP